MELNEIENPTEEPFGDEYYYDDGSGDYEDEYYNEQESY